MIAFILTFMACVAYWLRAATSGASLSLRDLVLSHVQRELPSNVKMMPEGIVFDSRLFFDGITRQWNVNAMIIVVWNHFMAKAKADMTAKQVHNLRQQALYAIKGLVTLVINSRMGRKTPMSRYFGEETTVLLTKLFPASMTEYGTDSTSNELLMQLMAGDETLIRYIVADKYFAATHSTYVLQSRGKMAMSEDSDGEVRYELRAVRNNEDVNPGHARGLGWHLEGNEEVFYDPSFFDAIFLAKAEEFVANCAMNDSVKEAGLLGLSSSTIYGVLMAQLELMRNGHRNGQKTVCTVHRSYGSGAWLLNIYNTKLLRACLVDTNTDRHTWAEYRLGVLLGYAENAGIKEATWSGTLKAAEKALKAAVRRFKDEPTPIFGDPEELLAFRIVREYWRNKEAIKNGTPFHWSVLIEYDQHASAFQYAGALFGDEQMLRASGAIALTKAEADIRKDFYTSFIDITPWCDGTKGSLSRKEARNLIKPIVTQLLYGKGTATTNGRIPVMDILLKAKDAKTFMQEHYNPATGLFDDPAIAGFVNEVYSKAVALRIIGHFHDLIQVSGKYFSTRRIQRHTLKLGLGEKITVETGKVETVKNTTTGELETFFVKKEVKFALPKVSRATGKTIWVPQIKKVDAYVTPLYAELGRRLPTAIVHHQDAVTMDMIVAAIIKNGGPAFSVHDAVITSPLYAEVVLNIMRERLWEVYTHRHDIWTEVFASIQKTYNPRWFALRNQRELTKEDFLRGTPAK